jgi:hypothetical protein
MSLYRQLAGAMGLAPKHGRNLDGSEHTTIGEVIAVVLGGCAIVAFLLFLCYYYIRRNSLQKNQAESRAPAPLLISVRSPLVA